MSQTNRRKAKSARKTAKAQGKAQTIRKARVKTGSAFGRAMAWLPLSEAQLYRAFLAAILGACAALAWFVASMAGVQAMAQRQLVALAGDAGFEVRRVDVRGVKHINELKVYERVLAERNQAMPLVDIHSLREKLLALPWIKDARVSRQLPETLVIDIIEREPHAVLRKPDRLVLIDATGHELETVSAGRAKDMLIVSGLGSGKRVVALSRLMEAAPALKPRVREAEWIGNRRWNITFTTDQVLVLPEGEAEAAKALVTFATLDGRNRLLGGKAVAFDMRAGDRIYFRIPGRAKQQALVGAGAARKEGNE